MYAATRGPNVKWGGQISNGGREGRAPLPPRWRRPCRDAFECIHNVASCSKCNISAAIYNRDYLHMPMYLDNLATWWQICFPCWRDFPLNHWCSAFFRRLYVVPKYRVQLASQDIARRIETAHRRLSKGKCFINWDSTFQYLLNPISSVGSFSETKSFRNFAHTVNLSLFKHYRPYIKCCGGLWFITLWIFISLQSIFSTEENQ